MTIGLWRAALAALAVLGGSAAAAPPKPLFASDTVLRLTIKGAIPSLSQEAVTSDRTVPATLTVQGDHPETLAITLAARGITRRAKDVCSFVPLRVEFPDKPGPDSLFKGQHKLKLVTHCKPAASYQQYYLLEYAAYRMYQQLTPVSFDARLALIDYVDANGKPIATRTGFFLEDADDVAKRNGLKRLETQSRVPVASLDAAAAARFVMFNTLIGNLDWAMTAGPAGTNCCHNSRLLAPEGATAGYIPVPYDFDFSGLVDAPYATPPAGIPLPNVRARRYRGYCRHNAEATAAAAELVAKRGALIAALDATPQLDADKRSKAEAYLNGFLDQIAAPGGTDKLFKTCLP